MYSTNRSTKGPLPLLGTFLSVLLAVAFLVPSALAQDSEPSQQQKAMHYSLYWENFKNDDFRNARSDLLWILENAPGFPKGDDRNFRRAYELYVELAAQASDEQKRRAYLDTAATYLTTSMKKMEEEGLEYDSASWEIRKGRFLQEHQDALPDLSSSGLKDPITHYRRAFELNPKEVDPYYIQQILRGYLENNKQSKALAFIEKVEQARGDDEEVKQILSSVREDIFGKNPQAKVKYLKKQLEAHPDSTQIMQDLFTAYVNQGNIEAASKLGSRLMKSDPPPETIREIAGMRLEDGRPKEALRAFERLQKKGELTAEDHFKMGQAYQQMNQLSKARSEFRQAIQLREDYGRAYIAIGDLYTRAVSECSGSELGRSDKAVYWAAVDMYKRAKEVDPSVASTANSKIQTYRKYFPTQEDIFYRDDWEKGGSHTIDSGCYSWIGETTTVRQAP